MDIIPTKVLGEPITIIGAGALGSWSAKALARMGFGNLTVIDYDHVDTVNLNSQGYKFSDVGLPKVEALKRAIDEETGVKIKTILGKYERGIFPGIVIAAVDNMKTRKLIWEEHKEIAAATKAIIDPRMGAEHAALFVVRPTNPEDIEGYPKSLFDDEDGVHEPCTAKATIYTAYLLSGLIVKAVKDLVTGKPNYLMSAQWDIAANEVLLWGRKPLPRNGQ